MYAKNFSQHMLCCPGQNTETGLNVDKDVLLNEGTISMLALFEFSSAHYSIDYSIFIHRIHTNIEFTDVALHWLPSYLIVSSY